MVYIVNEAVMCICNQNLVSVGLSNIQKVTYISKRRTLEETIVVYKYGFKVLRSFPGPRNK